MSFYPKKTEYKFIGFELLSETGKTTRWNIVNKAELKHSIGEIRYYPQWRQYCFFPFLSTVWNNTCLNDVNDFLKQLNDSRKKKR